MIVTDFLKYIRYELNLSTHTVLCYRKAVEQFVEFLVNDVSDFDAKSVTANDIRAWIVSLSKNDMATRSIRCKVQALRSFYKFLQKKNVIEVNPVDEIEFARIKTKLPTYIKGVDLDKIFALDIDKEDFEVVRNRLILLMFYTTGMRRAELIGLLDVNVDSSNCQLKVLGKRNKERIIPFGEELKQAIVEYRRVRDRECIQGETFFIRPNGEPLYPTLVYAAVNSNLTEAGLRGKKSPHVLRHTFASEMLNNGAQLNSVKEILGHESLAATQVYTHITFSELKQNYKLAHPRAIKKGG